MNKMEKPAIPHTTPRYSATFSNDVNSDIRRAAATGIYDIRGGGAKRKLPTFDDLLFLGASISRYPLEGYREKCETSVTIGTRYAKNPIELDIPITIAGMSFGALSGPAKEALGRGASAAGTSTTTGDGGVLIKVLVKTLKNVTFPNESSPAACQTLADVLLKKMPPRLAPPKYL